MNQNEGIQCDVCVRNNFRGCRYKCLICLDYDLCSECFESGSSSGNHVASHPMQSILTRSDMKLFFGGEDITGVETQCLTCPYCGELGFTGKKLMHHLIYRHSDLNESASSVLCPICAALPNGNNNFTTNDLPAHLAVEHRIAGPRSLITRIDDNAVDALRNPQPASSSTLTPAPTRRGNNSRSGRNSMDAVILELMSHLPDVRFGTGAAGGGGGGGSAPSAQALQQIQLQLHQQQLEARHQLDMHRLARRAFSGQLPPDFPSTRSIGPPSPAVPSSTTRSTSSGFRSREASALAIQAAIASEVRRFTFSGSGRRSTGNRGGFTFLMNGSGSGSGENIENTKNKADNGRSLKTEENDQFILNKFLKNDLNEMEHAQRDHDRADRSLFVQALLLSAFSTDLEPKDTVNSPVNVKILPTTFDAVKPSSSKAQMEDKKSKKKRNRKKKNKKQNEGGVRMGTVGDSISKVSVGAQSFAEARVANSKQSQNTGRQKKK